MPTTTNWQTQITLHGPDGYDTEALAGHLLERLRGSAAGYGPTTVTATFTATGAVYSEAYADARAQLDTAGIPTGWELVELNLVRADLADARLNESPIPRLVGISEVAEILGVTRQRTHAITTTPVFPDPIAHLAAGPVFLENAVQAFAERPRRPGRPAAGSADGTGPRSTPPSSKRRAPARKPERPTPPAVRVRKKAPARRAG